MNLTSKKLNPTKRVCLRLRDAREAAGVRLEMMARKLRIDKDHLVAIEACEFEKLPFAPVYQKNLIKSYIEALGRDPKSFVDQFVYEEVRTKKSKSQPIIRKQQFDSSYLPVVLRFVGMVSIVLVVIGYLIFQVKHIVEPPSLVIYTPEDGMITRDATITVHGKTDTQASIQINGKEVPGTEEGFFEEELTLSEGVNTVMFSAKKKHGKTTIMTHHIIYKKDSGLSFDNRENRL